MRVKFILPALTEAISPYWRPIKYSLFPPLGLATLAGYLGEEHEVVIQDEHVEPLDLDDEPNLVAIQAYITSAYRAYEIADHYRRRGAYVVLGGLHVTSLPNEASNHAHTIFLGPGEQTWPAFLEDLQEGRPRRVYRSQERSLCGIPPVRRDLIKHNLYLASNSIVVSRGCLHHCDFCYKDAFFQGGKSYYTQPIDEVLQEIAKMKGRHLFFLDDDLFASPRYAMELFAGMRGMDRVWQSAGTVDAVLKSGLLEKAVACGLRSLFIGFETLRESNLRDQHKMHNVGRDYSAAVHRLHDLGVMINASFVFGMDEDDESVFDRTVEWALEQGIETTTFHILTPYPGTALHRRMVRQQRITTSNWNLYDTRHAVFRPARMTAEQLEDGYWRAYRDFYSWSSIFKSIATKQNVPDRLRHLAYTGGWKKLEPLWGFVIGAGRVASFLPLLETVLRGRTRKPTPNHYGSGADVGVSTTSSTSSSFSSVSPKPASSAPGGSGVSSSP